MNAPDLTTDQKRLLVYATAYRGLVGMFMLAMGVGMASLGIAAYAAVEGSTDARMLAGVAAVPALLMAWSAARVIRSALSLWGLSKSSLPFSIPSRWQIIGGVADALF